MIIGEYTISEIFDGQKGEQGVSVSKVVTEWTKSTSPTQLPSNPTWSETKPSITSGEYLWYRDRTDLNNGTSTYSNAVCDVVISGVLTDVDSINNKITNKVWESDITSKINQYDGSTVSTIRDRVTQTEQDISGITTRVSDVESETDDLGTRMTSAESSITQNANNISAMVTVNGQTSAITLTQNMISAMTNQFVIKGSDNTTTVISGGKISANSIKTGDIATDAIKSLNYTASPNTNSPYSATGSFLDLSTGNFYTPNFGIDNTYGKAYLNGEIIADSGQIGSDSTNYWEIGTKTDYNANDSAAIIGHGSSYIQSGGWMISSDRIDTRSYDANRKYTYLNNNNTYWDFGLHVPNLTSTEVYENNFVYIRKHDSTIPTLESQWDYVFRIDRDGSIEATGLKINGTTIQDMITAGVDGGAYLPTSGGTISGNLTVTGTISGLKTLSINGKTYNGTSAVDAGTLGIAYGGTGQTTAANALKALIDGAMSGTSTPTDNDWYLSQYAGGGTSDTRPVKRPISALWTYIKGKINADTTLMTDKFVAKTGGEFTGAITVSDSFTADEISTGNLIVNGAGRFTNGLYGNLTGDVVGNLTGTATSASKLNSTRSFTVGKTTKNVDWSGAVSFSQAEISDNASTTAAGWMSKDDKLKLNGIETGAQVNTITGIKGGSETNYRTGNVNITASNIGLGNLTNDKQVKGLSSGTTSGHLVTWGSDGYTVADSGIAKGSVTTKITLAGTDYSASSNTITITKANLQAAVQDTSLVLMTSAERSKLSSIAVSEGGTIDFSGVTATAPITATVNQTTKAVNITHDTSGATAGTYRSVTVNTYGHVTGGTNPTTLSGYGITDAKIASGVITLGSNTITPLTASSTLDATKLSGTASISTTGNAGTATKFNSSRTISLSGDVSGTATADGSSGWSIGTRAYYLTHALNRPASANVVSIDHLSQIYSFLASSAMTEGKPMSDGTVVHFPWDNNGWAGQLYIPNSKNLHMQFRGGDNSSGDTNWEDWRTILDSTNYTDYTVTKTGTGASGTWGISISGTATKATQDGSGNIITDTYVNLTDTQTISGSKTFRSEVRMTAGGASDICSGVLASFKTNRSQITNLITHNIYTGGTNSTTPITFYKYGSVSSQAPATKTQLAQIDTDGNIHSTKDIVIAEKVNLQWNEDLQCLEFIFN